MSKLIQFNEKDYLLSKYEIEKGSNFRKSDSYTEKDRRKHSNIIFNQLPIFLSHILCFLMSQPTCAIYKLYKHSDNPVKIQYDSSYHFDFFKKRLSRACCFPDSKHCDPSIFHWVFFVN